MKERPILFSGPMVRAILDGRKTQTRRVVKGEPLAWIASGLEAKNVPIMLRSPYGQPGDHLWVRETHALIWPNGTDAPEQIEDNRVEYRADTDGKCLPGNWPDDMREDSECPKWRPSIHMPRWASRITLEITGVRCERLQEISEQDAEAEGIAIWAQEALTEGERWGNQRMNFAELWESIHGAGSWKQTPWVWVVEFKRLP